MEAKETKSPKCLIKNTSPIKEADESRARRDNIKAVTSAIQKVLLEKDRRYGSSTSTPIQVFTTHMDPSAGSSPVNMILTRLDDKLKRIQTSGRDPKGTLRVNDLFDTIGYISLLMVELGVTPGELQALID